MNKLRITFSLLTILMFCPMHKGMAQHTEALSDSLVYAIAMYQELYEEYKKVREDHMLDCSAMVAEFFGKVASAEDFTSDDFNRGVVNLSTNLVKDLGADLLSILDLSEIIKQKLGITISEEQAVGLSTVRDIYEIARANDTIMLAMACYPWRMVFDSRSVHRISLYEDGIDMLTDLTTLTTDSIQRDIYFNELMNIYDVWYEYADTINSQMDIEFSRTLIKSNKARKYDELLPALYRLKWDVGEDTINFKAIQKNVFTPEVDRLYNYMQDALYEQFHKEDVHYETPYKFFRLSHTRLVELNKMGKYKTYAEQYAKDFDSVNVRFEFYKTLSLEEGPKRNINILYNQVSSMYDEASSAMTIGSTKDWRIKEPELRKLLDEKRFLWDVGQEKPDPKFLNRIITSISNDSSEVYLEAMELYIELDPDSEGMLANIMKYRRKLAKTYENRQEYDKVIKLYLQIATDEKDPLKKSEAYYNAALISFSNTKNYNNAVVNCRKAIKSNPDFGDAYYLLGQTYANLHWRKNWKDNEQEKMMDKLIYLLAIDKYELALNTIRKHADDPLLSKYNRTKESTISNEIELTKYNKAPTNVEIFERGISVRAGDVLNILGEKVRVRFYQ